MSLLTSNILANYAGRGWVSAISLAVIPLYVKFMGIESYGLISFIATLQFAASLLHDGISMTLNRELARLSDLKATEERSRDVVRTLEVICWVLAMIISAALVILAPIVASYWIKVQELPTTTVVKSIMTMSLALGLAFPYNMYISGLMGLQQQKLVNIIVATTTTIRLVGAVAVLYFVSPSVEAYALWQIPAAMIQTFTAAFFLNRALPKIQRKARFEKGTVVATWRFYAGFSIATALLLLLLQADKIILSKLLPLDLFGYYALAWTLAISAIGLVSDPIRDASFPQLARHVQSSNISDLSELYHGCCQIAGSVLIPVTVIISLFANEILLAWTGNPLVAENTGPILRLLIIGVAFQGLNALPKNLQLAYGWTSLMTGMNAIALGVFAPLVIVLTRYNGPIGAAAAWIAIWGTYLMLTVWFTHRRILIGEQWLWYVNDIGLPLLATSVLAGVSRYIAPAQMSTITTLLFITSALSVCISLAALSAPQTRAWMVRRLKESLYKREPKLTTRSVSVSEKGQF